MIRFLTKIPALLTSFFSATARAWRRLSPEVQKAMVYGSGVIAIVNKYLDVAPAFVIDAIQKKYPELSILKLKEGLGKVNMALNIGQNLNSDELVGLVQNLQAYLSVSQSSIKSENKVWAIISHTAATAISFFLAPPATKLATVVKLIEHGYKVYVKPDIALAA